MVYRCSSVRLSIHPSSTCRKITQKRFNKIICTFTDRIRENASKIIQDIQVSQILDHMMTNLVISADDRRRIEQNVGQDDQNKALLDIVVKRREPVYSVFVDGLRNCGYKELANDLKYNSEEMSPSTTSEPAENKGIVSLCCVHLLSCFFTVFLFRWRICISNNTADKLLFKAAYF